jgi:hypothetical protein
VTCHPPRKLVRNPRSGFGSSPYRADSGILRVFRFIKTSKNKDILKENTETGWVGGQAGEPTSRPNSKFSNSRTNCFENIRTVRYSGRYALRSEKTAAGSVQQGWGEGKTAYKIPAVQCLELIEIVRTSGPEISALAFNEFGRTVPYAAHKYHSNAS